jgi:hypothetical protein
MDDEGLVDIVSLRGLIGFEISAAAEARVLAVEQAAAASITVAAAMRRLVWHSSLLAACNSQPNTCRQCLFRITLTCTCQLSL